MGGGAVSSRQRNVRGEGSRLRSDIVAAALTIIDRGSGAEAVTLRSVAREVGIAAPSIYVHFADPASILRAAGDEVFRDLINWLHESVTGIRQPQRRLRAYCLAYLTFAASQPERYELLFSRDGRGCGVNGAPLAVVDDRMSNIGLDAFNVLLDGVRNTDGFRQPLVAATAIWAGLHGVATLRIGVSGRFPWPSDEALVGALLEHGG